MERLTGLASWLAAAVAAWLVAGAVRTARPRRRLPELAAAVAAALGAGLAATRLDFGGLAVLDPRAIAFAFLLALAAAGVVRAMTR